MRYFKLVLMKSDQTPKEMSVPIYGLGAIKFINGMLKTDDHLLAESLTRAKTPVRQVKTSYPVDGVTVHSVSCPPFMIREVDKSAYDAATSEGVAEVAHAGARDLNGGDDDGADFTARTQNVRRNYDGRKRRTA